MQKIRALSALSLLILTSCSSSILACPIREPYIGVTYGDAISYLGTLERQYDGCAGVN